MAIVEDTWPKLRPTDQEPHHRRAFVNAVHFCCFVQRTPKLNGNFALSYYTEAGNAFCRRYSLVGYVTDKAITTAMCASGIRTSPLTRWPFDTEFACNVQGTAPAPIAGWRDVLENGLAPPLDLKWATPPIRQQMLYRGESGEATA